MAHHRYQGPTNIGVNVIDQNGDFSVLRSVTNTTTGALNLTMNYDTSYHQAIANPSTGATSVTLGTAASYGNGVSGVDYVAGSARVFVETFDFFGQSTETEVTSSVTQGTGANINVFSGFTGLVSGDRVRATYYTYNSADAFNLSVAGNTTLRLDMALNDQDHFDVPSGLWVSVETGTEFRPGNK